MTLWFVLALMTAAAVFAVLWPLGRRGNPASGSDVAVYRDQLDEIERDRAAGLIGEAEAEAARVEVSRRLLAAAESAEAAKPKPVSPTLRRATAIAALVALPLGAGALYLTTGSPGLPGQPLSARQEASAQERLAIQERLAARIAEEVAYLQRNPNDGERWEALAYVFMRLGRFEEGLKGRRNALRLLGSTPDREADLGEALLMVNKGVVTAEAKESFQRAIAKDASHVKARFFLGVSAEQDGRRDEAIKIWSDMLASAPPNAPWVDAVKRMLVRVGATPPPSAPQPGPSAADVEAAAGLTPEQRAEMIRGMVERLADRLKSESSDVEGWQRLVRAYMVIGDREKARAAAGDARKALTAEPDKLRKLNEFVKELGLEG
jgi:cytochrome c-type biogenesis protein CcmH